MQMLTCMLIGSKQPSKLSTCALPRPTMSCCCPSSTQRAGSTQRTWMTGIALAATTRATPLSWSDADAAAYLEKTIMLCGFLQ